MISSRRLRSSHQLHSSNPKPGDTSQGNQTLQVEQHAVEVEQHAVEVVPSRGDNLEQGAHTIGQARCTSFRARIYNESNIDASFAQTRQRNCPRTTGSGDNNLAPLDIQTPTSFDNNYFKNLVSQRGLLHSDQQLFNGGSTDSIVRGYGNSPSSFNSDFVSAMIKMGDISPLTGSRGEIRKNCRRVN
ncbi:hypothetical protein Goshw_024594 [Gossypium schwendimanii]|uniref:peroxidase n=1 Tax=Gossypium schwendimanii TaxID=34291 RepID=A0A7J9MQ04_GOSSC|nr:hypothetical protein [Gossypium schwendimanii]